MRSFLCLAVVFVCGLSLKSQPLTQAVDSSQYFEFHINYWTNFHHFFYQQAKGSQLRKLEEDGMAFPDIGEDSLYRQLNADQLKNLKEAVLYYQYFMANKDLRRDLREERGFFQRQKDYLLVNDSIFTNDFYRVLNEASEVYRYTFWPLHKAHCEKVLSEHVSTIREMEQISIERMEKLAGYPWPAKTKVRVDITAYANYAGAYTPTRPNMTIIISTLDPLSSGTSFIETIFHEGTHLLFPFKKSPFRDAVYTISEEIGLKYPQGFWHACQFYLCGRVVQDQLKKRGISHTMDMDLRNIYRMYNTKEFRSTLEQYYIGQADMETTVRALLTALKK